MVIISYREVPALGGRWQGAVTGDSHFRGQSQSQSFPPHTNTAEAIMYMWETWEHMTATTPTNQNSPCFCPLSCYHAEEHQRRHQALSVCWPDLRKPQLARDCSVCVCVCVFRASVCAHVCLCLTHLRNSRGPWVQLNLKTEREGEREKGGKEGENERMLPKKRDEL